MFTNYLEQMSSIYDNMDSVMIVNREGIVEYAAVLDTDDDTMRNEGYTGMPLLEVYPELKREESTVYHVLETGEPVIEEVQTLTDCNGKTFTLSCSTYPIALGDKIIGAIEGSVLLNADGKPVVKQGRRAARNVRKGSLYTLDDIITVDTHMNELKEQVMRVAAGDSPVMIIGDTGTGKELVAQSLHSHSRRASGPFVSQNCSAIPMGLLESTLFGTVRGSYTGAVDRRGLFELASGGTLFLDELNSMEIGLQGKILKAVEEQKIRRIGEEKERRIDVRIVSALNCEPHTVIEAGEMRKDLFFRLGVVQIRLPLLHERRGDITVLTEHFIEHFNERSAKKISGCSELAGKALLNYSWPGNVRELRNVVEYGFNMARGSEITLKDLPENLLYDKKAADEDHGRSEIAGRNLTEAVEAYERSLIEEACRETRNVTDAAARLGISRQALRYKMTKYGLDR